MTWALAKITKFFAICMSLRNSLKILKKVTLSEHNEAISEQQRYASLEQCSGILMFWTIFGVTVVGEQYFEFLIRWFPMYYYLKSFFILFMAFPRLRFTEYVFYKVLVPTVEFVHDNVGNISSMPPGDILLLLIFKLVFICFPMINHPDGENISELMPSATKVLIINSDSDGEEDGVDLDSFLDQEDMEVETDIAPDLVQIDALTSSNREISDDFKVFEEKDVHEKECFKKCDDDYSAETDLNFSLSFPNFDDDNYENDKNNTEVNNAFHEPDVRSINDDNSRRDSHIENPSRVLKSFRKLLTGDSSTRLSDTIFNLDLHSPPPNTQYRNRRRSSISNHSSSPQTEDVSPSSPMRGKVSRQRNSVRKYLFPEKTFSPPSKDGMQNSEAMCYSPLHHSGTVDKENVFEDVDPVDSLDTLLIASSEKKSHVTLPRRKKNQNVNTKESDDDYENKGGLELFKNDSKISAKSTERCGHRVLRSSTNRAEAKKRGNELSEKPLSKVPELRSRSEITRSSKNRTGGKIHSERDWK